jgi:hypothetical protein
MSDGIVVPGRFGSPTARARQQLSEDLARLLIPYLNELGWDTVVNDLLAIAGGFISNESQKPAKDLATAAAFIKRYDWRRAKRLMFAAKQGIQPDQVKEQDLKQFEVDDEVPGDAPKT